MVYKKGWTGSVDMSSHRGHPLVVICHPSRYSSAMDHRGLILGILLAFACLSAVVKAESCETQCGGSCCPHANGVCCEGDSSCCRQGQTCLSNIDTCIGFGPTTHGNATLLSEKASPVAGLACPSGTTPCEGGCCPYSDGVCCNDGYCCPEGFKCTPDSCEIDGVRNQSLRKGLAGQDPAVNIMGHKLKDLGIQICPDKLHLCPGSAECCKKDNGQWDCCPKVAVSTGQCCNQLGFIWICCTDEVPLCYWWGCWFSEKH